ncbi:helix-turn-helix transcriptional regulator [Rossellomorea oryzaecorticis]|uniref:Helix-turn-helix transcriptional regulator n=1 Tax=Rossellomorea oryzaecorticis TaxID=1396505 RepID=A0ABU9K4V2_9BACI
MLKSNLKEILDSRRITIREFSRMADFRFESCRQMYHGTMTRYPGELIEKACKALNVMPNDLFAFVEEEEADDERGM